MIMILEFNCLGTIYHIIYSFREIYINFIYANIIQIKIAKKKLRFYNIFNNEIDNAKRK